MLEKLMSKKYTLTFFGAISTSVMGFVMLFKNVEPPIIFWAGYFAIFGVYVGVQGLIDKKKVENGK